VQDNTITFRNANDMEVLPRDDFFVYAVLPGWGPPWKRGRLLWAPYPPGAVVRLQIVLDAEDAAAREELEYALFAAMFLLSTLWPGA